MPDNAPPKWMFGTSARSGRTRADPRAAEPEHAAPAEGEGVRHGRVAGSGRFAMTVCPGVCRTVPGRLYPLVATLLKLADRGHHVAVRGGIRRCSSGCARRPRCALPPIRDRAVRARRLAGANALRCSEQGARPSSASALPFQLRDLEQAIEAERPDVLFVDEGAWGAAAAAERSGLPWAFSIVSPIPLPSRDAPPFGLGLRPRRDRLGRLRDRVGEAADARHARARDRQAHEPAPR